MRVRALLLALAVVTASHLAAATPAAACSCTSGPSGDQQYVGWADAVFVADFVSYTGPPQDGRWTGLDPAVWTLDVSAVYKGEVADRQDVVSAVNGGACGLELPHSGRFLIFASKAADPATTVDGPVLYSHLCTGTRALGADEVPALLEKPKPPLAGIRAAVLPPRPSPTDSAYPTGSPSASVSPSALATVSAAGQRPGSGNDWATVVAWSTGGIALATLAGVLLLPRRRRR